MKKVGIVTILGNNYGGTLQGYAMKEKIQDLGFSVYQINYIPKYKKRGIKDIVQSLVYFQRNRNFIKFRRDNFKLSKKYKNIESIEKKYDMYVAGSDQIWNSQISMENRRFFYLDFVKGVRKVAYAASVGKDYFTESAEEQKEISRMLNDFSYISIREDEGVKLYQQLVEKKIENVLDPTLLLDKNRWLNIEKKYNKNQDFIFVYLLGYTDRVVNVIDQFSKKNDIKIVDLYYKKKFENLLNNENHMGPSEFLGVINSASIVITNSFHGTVFSILFEKEFYVITQKETNSRIYTLLKKLNLTDRIIDKEKIEQLINKDIKKINYKEVKDILKRERKKSEDFLKNALGLKEE